MTLAIVAVAPAASAQPVNPFSDWAAVVVAADYHDGDGRPAKVFDNARQDLTKALVGVGFAPGHIAQFSVRPQLYEETPFPVSPPQILPRELKRLTDATRGGCLFFLTSHGDPRGVIYGKDEITPLQLAAMLDGSCGARPTVAIISACYSGVFVPPLQGANRLVLTAARPDRPSFGCSQDEVYTYFDGCLLESLPASSRFDVLADKIRSCVARREGEVGAPASGPQLSIGKDIAALLPSLSLEPRGPG